MTDAVLQYGDQELILPEVPASDGDPGYDVAALLKSTGHTALVIAGGVGANRRLRADLAEAAARRGARVYYPRPGFCTDNAAMIAYAGYRRLAAGEHGGQAIRARPRWPLDELQPIGH